MVFKLVTNSKAYCAGCTDSHRFSSQNFSAHSDKLLLDILLQCVHDSAGLWGFVCTNSLPTTTVGEPQDLFINYQCGGYLIAGLTLLLPSWQMT